MFPDIGSQDGLTAVGHRSVGIIGVDDLHAAVVVLHQPGPAGAEVASPLLVEPLFEVLKGTEGLADGIGQGPAGLTAPLGAHTVPVEGVVPDLGGLIEQPSRTGLLNDFLQGHILVFGAGNHAVELVHVGLMVLAMVELQGFGGDMGFQGVLGIGQIRQFKGHTGSLLYGIEKRIRTPKDRPCLPGRVARVGSFPYGLESV